MLWSSSGALTKILTLPSALGLHEPALTPLQIASWRVLFAGSVLIPLLRRRDICFRGAMVFTALCFAIMNALFITALALGSSANAILLQYTAPMWVTFICVWFLHEPADRRSVNSLCIGLVGIAIIIFGGWFEGGAHGDSLPVIGIALGSGAAYAGVLIGLRLLRDCSPIWLTVVNHLFSGLVLFPFIIFLPTPSLAQFAFLFLYGALQMALPYWLMAHALKSISPQEAGTLSLMEPLLNPFWAYLATTAMGQPEIPSIYSLGGGFFILLALIYRYWPRGH